MAEPSADTSVFRIVLVAFRSQAVLQTTLDALAAQSFRNFRAVVVDNACPQGSGVDARLPDARFHLVRSDTNRGFSGGANLGAMSDVGDTGEAMPPCEPWIVTLNPDAVARPDWLEHIFEAINVYDADMFGSTQIQQDTGRVDGFGDVMSVFGLVWRGGYGSEADVLPSQDRSVLTPCAAAACYRRAAFERAGGFDESFFCYLEDVDLGLRLRADGSDCVQLRGAVVDHLGGSSQEPGSQFALHQTQTNLPRLAFKTVPMPVLAVMLPLMLVSQVYLGWRNRRNGGNGRFWRSVAKLGTHMVARRASPRLGARELVRYLSWSPRSARHLPIVSRPAPTRLPETKRN